MDTLPIINKTYEVYKHIIVVNTHIKKQYRHSLGISIEQGILTLLEHLIMAKNAPKTIKSGYLLKASSDIEITALKIRLLLELKLVNETRVFQLQAQCAEIGRMLGGWLKSLQS